jgi:hypothetical protein
MVLLVGCMLFSGLWVTKTEAAEDSAKDKFLCYVIQYDGEEITGYGIAVPMCHDSTYYVVTDENVYTGDDIQYYYFSCKENLMLLDYVQTYSNLGVVLFSVSDGYEPDDTFYEAASPVQGQSAEMLYYDADGNECTKVLTVNELTGNDEGQMGMEVEGFPEESIKYPAVVIDESGQCLGLVVKGNFIWTTYADAEAFYADSEGEAVVEESDSEQEENSVMVGSGKENGQSGSTNVAMVAGIVAVLACVIAAAAVLAIRHSKKKKTSGAQKPEEYGATMPMKPEEYGATMPTKPEEYGATMPLKPEEYGATMPMGVEEYGATMPLPRQTELVSLKATDGPLKDMVFPLRGEELILGTENNSFAKLEKAISGVDGRHCRLFISDGKLMLEDLGSEMGTYLKRTNERVVSGSPVCVEMGTEFYLGKPENSFLIQ